MFQLCYSSIKSNLFTPETDISKILYNARTYNESKGVTGILLYRAGIFLQYLEGEKNQVLDIYQNKIVTSSLHNIIKVIFEQETKEERLFNEWTMGYREINDVDLHRMNSMIKWSIITSKNNEHINNNTILELLKLFRYQEK